MISMRATGMPSWIVWITVFAAPAIDSNGHTAARTASGRPYKPQRELGDHAERAFGADEQPRQVVAGR